MAGEQPRDVPIIDDAAMELGQLYRSTAVLGAGGELPTALRPEQWAGQPGTRAPHSWVSIAGERHSMLDLFQDGWVLLADDARWRTAAAHASELGLTLQCACIGVDVQPSDSDALRAAFGIGAGGASLIRPDGYIAWRVTALPTDPARALTDALAEAASTLRRASR
jgi:putative polyketide hydroxylase